jgi:hypothetical protein
VYKNWTDVTWQDQEINLALDAILKDLVEKGFLQETPKIVEKQLKVVQIQLEVVTFFWPKGNWGP